MNNEVESYVGELRELRKLKETLTKQNEELKYEINKTKNYDLNINKNYEKRIFLRFLTLLSNLQ